jgi:hypothetical protein
MGLSVLGMVFFMLVAATEPRSGSRNHEDLRGMSYREYLQTLHWKRKREEKLRRWLQVPALQQRIRRPRRHHRTYERLGEELDEDLTVLCRECHSWYHERQRFGR